MTRPSPPIIAVASDVQTVGDQRRYTVDVVPVDTLARTVGAVPLIVPSLGNALDIPALLDRVDGVMVTGGLSNVSPRRYGRVPSEKDGPFDEARDATTLPLIGAAIRRGVPLLLTCRGLQELNVALGGSLKREDTARPQELRHGTPPTAENDDQRYRIRQTLDVVSGGQLQRLLGQNRAEVNSLHSQVVDELAPGLIPEAYAQDGTVEAVSVANAAGYVLAVIFHPEYWAERDPVSRAILESFSSAVHAYAGERVKSTRPHRLLPAAPAQ
jgi:putative glutamine amidotransferase